jgi:hypothetical protein
MHPDRFLHVDGTRLADATGATVVLRGYNVGGFLNMEVSGPKVKKTTPHVDGEPG